MQGELRRGGLVRSSVLRIVVFYCGCSGGLGGGLGWELIAGL